MNEEAENLSVATRAGKAGMPPGSIVHVGVPKSTDSIIYAVVYNSSEIEEKCETTIDQAIELKTQCNKENGKYLWINIDGLGNLEAIKKLEKAFGIHPLVLEDISNPQQRPKAEHYENYSFMVLRTFNTTPGQQIVSEQVSIILGNNFLISIQEKEGDVFSGILEGLKNNGSRLRTNTLDYLAYRLLDSIVDGYFSVLELFGNHLEEIEAKIVETPTHKNLKQLYRYKRKALELRRGIWPVRELLSNLDRSDSKFVSNNTKVYLRDVYSHAIEVIDTLEIYREVLGGLLDVYLSSASNRLNEVMKALTAITTIFMPISFIAGVYGMNFENMPALKSPYGYAAVIGIMFAIGLVMFIFFKTQTLDLARYQSMEIPVYAKEEVLERVDGDKAFLIELTDEFLTSFPKQFEELSSFINQQDTEKAKNKAHTLKGALRNLGALQSGDLAFQIESACTKGDLSTASTLLANFKEAIKEFSIAYQKIK